MVPVWPRRLIASVLVPLAVVVQASLLSMLRLPGPAPDLLLAVLVALGVAYGPGTAALSGFVGGLLVDLAPPADHAIGRLALAYTLAGYLAGRWREPASRTVLWPFVLVMIGGVVVVGTFALTGLILGDGRLTWSGLLVGLLTEVGYALVAVPFLVPLVAWWDRTLAPRPGW